MRDSLTADFPQPDVTISQADVTVDRTPARRYLREALDALSRIAVDQCDGWAELEINRVRTAFHDLLAVRDNHDIAYGN